MNQQNLSAFIWSVADLLRGDYKQSDYSCCVINSLGRDMTGSTYCSVSAEPIVPPVKAAAFVSSLERVFAPAGLPLGA